MNKIVGVIVQNSKYYAECICKQCSKAIKIKKKYLSTAIHGDTVLIKTDNTFGMVSKVIKRTSEIFIGKASVKNNTCFITPVSDNLFINFFADAKIYKNIKDGDIVLFTFRSWKKSEQRPVANILKSISMLEAVAMKYNITPLFSKECIKEAESLDLGTFITSDREDLRYLNIVSYSASESFCTGISIEEAKEGFRVGIHVPAVAEVLKDCPHIMERTSSSVVGMPEIPLLPRKIISMLSMTEGNVIPAVSFLIRFDREYKILGSSITRSIVKVRNNINSSEFTQIIKSPDHILYKDLSLLSMMGNLISRKTQHYDQNWKEIAEYMIADYTLQSDNDDIIYFNNTYSYNYNGRCHFTEPFERYVDIINQYNLFTDDTVQPSVLHLNTGYLNGEQVKKILRKKEYIRSLKIGQEVLGTVTGEDSTEYCFTLDCNLKVYMKKRKALVLRKGDKSLLEVCYKCEDTLMVRVK